MEPTRWILRLGVPPKSLGVDPATAAVARARRLAGSLNLKNCLFRVGNIYELAVDPTDCFDIAVLRGVLHHLPDPQRAVTVAVALAPVIMIVEPNGLNPILKMLERFSPYHLRHEEQSFLPRTVDTWCTNAGATIAHRESHQSRADVLPGLDGAPWSISRAVH